MSRHCFETDRLHQFVEVVDDALVETIELAALGVRQLPVVREGIQQARGQRRVDPFEELEKDQRDRVTARRLGKAMAVVGTDDGVGEIEILDDGLELAPIAVGDLAPQDRGEFRWLADGAIGIEQARPESVQGCAAAKDQVVANFNLREKETMLTSCQRFSAFLPIAMRRRAGSRALRMAMTRSGFACRK